MPQTQMEKCCQGIINVFCRYSRQSEPYNTLCMAEFAKLLKEQLPNFIQDDRASGDGNRLFKEMDKNKDGQLSLEEFMTFLGKLLITSHYKFHHDH